MHVTCIKQDPTCIQTCNCLLHVAISKYMHVLLMFHVTCRDLGRFTGMLHAYNMLVMLHACHVVCMQHACTNMHATCVLHAYCMHKHACYMHSACMLHACCMHATCTLHACYMHSACMLHARCMHATCTLHACYMHACYMHAACIPCTDKMVVDVRIRTKHIDNTETGKINTT